MLSKVVKKLSKNVKKVVKKLLKSGQKVVKKLSKSCQIFSHTRKKPNGAIVEKVRWCVIVCISASKQVGAPSVPSDVI
jgi:hypothetical protein